MKEKSIDELLELRLRKQEKAMLMAQWFDEWGMSVRDCLAEQSNMFKPAVKQLDEILKYE